MKAPHLLALLLALALLPHVATAHVQDARPSYGPPQVERIVQVFPRGLDVVAELTNSIDPIRQTLRHDMRPSSVGFVVEHREDGSQPGDAFVATWRVERVLEYRDNNLNGRWEPATDTLVRASRPQVYPWRTPEVREVQVADIRAEAALWEANLTGAPDIRLEVVAAGRAFSDEGALVRPQDLAIYLDFLRFPPRAIGSLHAVEMEVTTSPAAALGLYEVDGVPTALHADIERRRALLVWGGEALVDGAERRLGATLEEAAAGENSTARLTLHLPAVEREARFVMTWGIEYLIEVKRGMAAAPPGAILLAAAGAALAAGRGSFTPRR